MAGYGSMSGLGLQRLTIGGDQHGGHQAQGSETLGEDVGLNISIIVLAEAQTNPPEELESLSDHVIDQAVLVPDLLLLEFLLVIPDYA